MYDWDLQVAPGPPLADLKRRMLEEWLRNPFLDDDVKALGARLASPENEVAGALTGLCEAGFLRPAGTGYALSPDLADGRGEAAASRAGSDPGQRASLSLEIEESLADLVPGQSFDDAGLVDALPFGLVVLRPSGTAELANGRAAEMLGVPLADLDGTAFQRVTGRRPPGRPGPRRAPLFLPHRPAGAGGHPPRPPAALGRGHPHTGAGRVAAGGGLPHTGGGTGGALRSPPRRGGAAAGRDREVPRGPPAGTPWYRLVLRWNRSTASCRSST